MTPLIWILLLAGMNVLWACSSVVVKIGLTSLDPLALVFWRFAAALVILAAALALKRPRLGMRRGDALRILAAGLLLGLTNWLWVAGIDLSHATDASLLYVFEPISGIILASIFLRERILPTTIAGLLLVLVGLAALANFDLRAFGWEGGGVGRGNLLVALGLICEGCFSITLKPMARRVPAIVTTAGVLAVALALLTVPILARGTLPAPTGAHALFAVAYLAVICTVVGYTLWVKVMKHVPVGVMLFTVFLQPLLGPFVAWATLGETIDRRIVTGGLFLIGGMAVAVAGHLRAQRKGTTAAEDAAIEIAGTV